MGIATVTTVNPHGLRVDHRVEFTGFTTFLPCIMEIG